MNRARAYAWGLAGLTGGLLASLVVTRAEDAPPVNTMVFWIVLLAAVELLPVTLGFGTAITMTMPIHLALAILYEPWAAMAITAISAIDLRELKGELPLWRALFNRAQITLAVGATCTPFAVFSSGDLTPAPVILGALGHLVANLTLVALMLHLDQRVPLLAAIRNLLPDPPLGFAVSYAILIGLGVVTALAYEGFGAWAVAAIIIPILFARLSILGARAQQELSERVRKQQQALLDATERVFQERENERQRIAEEIHDSSLQMLAAAAYGCGNAEEFIDAGRFELAQEAVNSARTALDDAIQTLRGSLVDLRRSSVEQGGLMDTIKQFVDHAQTLWGTEVRIEGTIDKEPPLPVAVAAFQILQEGLTNALKHAQSSTVTVRIESADSLVNIVVEDDGTGFDPDSEVGTEHVGMRLMRERAARVGGSVELDTKPGAGTRLRVILPGGVTQ
jgi:signal transduction histidine kinase